MIPGVVETHRRRDGRLGRLLIALLGLLTALSVVAPAALAADPITVTITNQLEPASLTVPPGTAVTWRNDDSDRHRMRSFSGPEDFDSGNLDPGQSFTFIFSISGTYQYLDERNNDNSAYFGSIVVSGSPDPAPGPGPAGDANVDIVDRAYRPTTVTVVEGSRVSWRNIDDRSHTVTARDRAFDSGIFDTGAGWSRTFATPGTFEYFCTLHPEMVGTVIVTSSDGELPPPEPDPSPPPPLPPPSPAPSGDINIVDNAFSPSSRTVSTGTSLTWSNTGALPHTVTRSGSFDSGILMPGDTYTRTFNTAGTFSYLCTIHPEMVGTVIVTGTTLAGGDETGAASDEDGVPEVVTSPSDGSPEGSGDSGPDTPQASGPTQSARMIDLDFMPGTMTIVSGTTVTWTNKGALPHTVTDRAGSFDSGIVAPDGTFVWTFADVGTYEYFCTLHPGMIGTVVVQPAPAPTVEQAVPSVPAAAAGDGGPSTLVAVILAGSVAAFGIALASGMAIFGRLVAVAEGGTGSGSSRRRGL